MYGCGLIHNYFDRPHRRHVQGVPLTLPYAASYFLLDKVGRPPLFDSPVDNAGGVGDEVSESPSEVVVFFCSVNAPVQEKLKRKHTRKEGGDELWGHPKVRRNLLKRKIDALKR